MLEEALAQFRQLGDRGYIAYTQLLLGTMASALGDYDRARALYRATLAIRKELQEKRGIATCLAALACAASGLKDYERAAQLFGAAESLRETVGASIPAWIRGEYDRQVAVTSSALGEAVCKAAWAAGREMPLEQAVDSALSEESRVA